VRFSPDKLAGTGAIGDRGGDGGVIPITVATLSMPLPAVAMQCPKSIIIITITIIISGKSHLWHLCNYFIVVHVFDNLRQGRCQHQPKKRSSWQKSFVRGSNLSENSAL
jgi:hypothetical protein